MSEPKPHSYDPIGKKRESILFAMQIIHVFAGLMGAVSFGLIGAYWNMIPPLLVFIAMMTSLTLRNGLSITMQSHILIAVLWLTATLGPVVSGGLASPHFFWVLPPALLGGLLLGWKTSIIYVFASSFVVASLFLFDETLQSWVEPEIIDHMTNIRLISITGMAVFLLYYSYAFGVELQRALKEAQLSNERLQLLERIAGTANQSSSSQETFTIALREICGFLGWPLGSFYVTREDGEALVPSGLYHFDDEEQFSYFRDISQNTVFPSGAGVPGLTLQEKRAIWIENIYTAPDFKTVRKPKQSKVRAAIGIPIRVADKIAGVMEFYSSEAVPEQPEVLEILAQVGTHLGRAIEREQIEQARIEQREAEASNVAKSAFLANMSHEIRTPMNGVIGMAEIMSHSNLTPDQAGTLRVIRQSSESLLRIIDDILDISKIEAGKLDLEMAPVSIQDLTEGVMSTLRTIANEQNVHLTFDLRTQITFIQSDAIRLRQILMNLLNNAIKFSCRKDASAIGEVNLSVEDAGPHSLRFVVTDNGIGMSEDFINKLFLPFSQAEEATTREYGGTGLGMTITKNLIDKLQGKIEVVSQQGKGSTFTVTLPVVEADGVNTAPDLTGITVLALVDDIPSANVLFQYLEAPGAQVALMQDETEFFNRLKSATPKTVILLGLQTAKENERIRQTCAKINSEFRYLNVLNGDDTQPTSRQPDSISIQRRPLIPSELINNIAVLAGRASPQIDHDLPVVQTTDATVNTSVSGRILLVEDNPTNQQVISMQLQMLGYTADLAENGKEGLEAWESGSFDLVLTDCHMPLMDGFEMTKEIRRREKSIGTVRIPIVAITANALKGEYNTCIAAGMDDYLSKPVILSDLKKTIDGWLASETPHPTHAV